MPLRTLPDYTPPKFETESRALNDRFRDFVSFWEEYQQYNVEFLEGVLTAIQTIVSQPVGTEAVAAAATIEPLQPVQLVSGTATISNISTVPDWSQLILIAVDGFSLATGGNIAVNKQLLAGEAIILAKNFQDETWYTLSAGAEFLGLSSNFTDHVVDFTDHAAEVFAHHGSDAHGDIVQAAAVVDSSPSSVSVDADDATSPAEADAPEVTAANASDLPSAITLVNEIKADYNVARALINELKGVATDLTTLGNEAKADINTAVTDLNASITQLNALLASMRVSNQLGT